MIVYTTEENGKTIEIYADRFWNHRYGVTVQGRVLYQRGRTRVRVFGSVIDAMEAARKEARS